MPSDLIINSTCHIPARELTYFFARSSGKGGQNVNKVSSKASLKWRPHSSVALSNDQKERFIKKFSSRINKERELIITSEKFREQRANLEETRKRLVQMIRSILRPDKKRIPVKPSRAMKEARLKNKKYHSSKKRDRRKITSS